eukprot:symbB.v1.2.007055.t1/scaffold414.1/size398445/19
MGALRLIHQHMEKKRLRTIDLFRIFDQSNDGSITRSELRKGLEEIGVEMDPASFKALVGHLDRDSGATINLKELDRGIKEALREKYPKDTKIDPERYLEYELLKEINKALFSGTQMIFGHRVTDSRSFFRAIDKDNSGELDAAELARGLMKLGILVDSEGVVQDLVGCIDKNASGLIDKEEFIKALQHPEELLAKPEQKKERKVVQAGSEEDATKALAMIHEQLSTSRTRTTDWFYKMDTSRDGKISRVELKKGLKDMGCSLSASDLKAVLLYLDNDESGSVSLQELQKGMNRAVRAVAEAAGKLEPVVVGPAKNAYEALVQINSALRSNTQLILGMRVTDGRSFFKAMDKDNSGSLDVAEVARGLKRLGIEASEALLDEIVAAIDVNKNGLIDMKEFVHALKLPQDVADPEAPPPQAAPEPSEDVTPPEPAEVIEDTTMAGLAKRLSQASQASRASHSSPQALPEAEATQTPRSPPRSPRVSRESAVPALQDLPAAPAETLPEAESAEGPQSPPAEATESPESPSGNANTKGDSTRKSSTTPRKSQAKGSSNASGGLLSRASRAMGSLAGSSSTSTTRRQTQLNTRASRATLNRGSPSPQPSNRGTTRASTARG